jgi:transposase
VVDGVIAPIWLPRSAKLSEAAWAWIEPFLPQTVGHDAPRVLPLIAHMRVQRTIGRPRTRPDRLLADKAYSWHAIRAHLRTRISSVIPEPDDQLAHRKRIGSSGGRPVTYDRTANRRRNVIERAFNGFKHWRGLATRYDKHAIVYRGGLVLAAVLLWLSDLGDTS